MKNEKRSSLFILAACFLWALDILVRYPLTLKISFIHIVFIESFLGLFFVLPWLVTEGLTSLQKMQMKDWLLAMFLGGFGMTVAGFLSTESILRASPAAFSFLQIFQPLFVVYAANVFLKEKVLNRYFYWGLWAILSALMMFSRDLELSLKGDLSMFSGGLLIGLGTMLIWGLCTIAGKKLLVTHKPLTVVVMRWIFAFIFSAGFLAFDKEPVDLGLVLQLDIIWRFMFIGLVSGTASMLLYYKGMKELPAARISFLELSYPALGMIFSSLYTYDKLTFLQALGLGSFFVFILVVMGKSKASDYLMPQFSKILLFRKNSR